VSILAASDGSHWYGLDAALTRRLQVHEARAHQQTGRRLVDLGDAVLLHDPDDRDPFLNRMLALRLSDQGVAFDRRLGDLLLIFATLDRPPHLWLGPGFHTPADLADRLRAEGFAEVAASCMMLDVRADPDRAAGFAESQAGSTSQIVRVSSYFGPERSQLLDAAAKVLLEAFDVPGPHDPDLARSLDPDGHRDVYVVFSAGEPVAAGRRFTADGATYLSSIGTRPRWRGRGYGAAVTRRMARDARRAAPNDPVHLSVDAANVAARALYRRVGFAEAGDLALHFLLA
jgi:GNAT superfamily N-acetyltransferase